MTYKFILFFVPLTFVAVLLSGCANYEHFQCPVDQGKGCEKIAKVYERTKPVKVSKQTIYVSPYVDGEGHYHKGEVIED